MQFQQNISLKPYNTFGIDVVARYFAPFATVAELHQIAKVVNKDAKLQMLVMGGGSNLLLTQNFDGLVTKNELEGIEVVGEDDNYYYVKAGAGENWHHFVQYCIKNNFAGVENLSLIPGSVGASPMQNIGAYGVEIKDVFYSLEALHIHSNNIVTFTLQECEFGYRESIFKTKLKGQYIITSVTYRLHKVPVYNTSYGAIQAELEAMGVKSLSLAAVSQAVINIRQSKLPDPEVIGNAGSFFKNPTITSDHYRTLQLQHKGIPGYGAGVNQVKVAAGWLIEQCGYKGYRKGDAGCHAKQALVLVNYGNATGKEILALSEEIIAAVYEKFRIQLEREVNII